IRRLFSFEAKALKVFMRGFRIQHAMSRSAIRIAVLRAGNSGLNDAHEQCRKENWHKIKK
ncbi:hypothetical protein, partial [Bordetella avium]